MHTLDRTAAPRELHIVDALPMRGIGKVDRQALARHAGNVVLEDWMPLERGRPDA